jgi:adenylate cyclase, class 2
MKEIEVKILDIDAIKAKKILLDNGAEKVVDGDVEAIHYDFPDRRIKQKGESLRLRKIDGVTELVVKGKHESEEVYMREEIETQVKDFEEMQKIFEKIGLIKTIMFKKKRESYKLGKTKFEFDTYPNFPTFVEVEAPTEKEVEQGVEFMGYTMKETHGCSIIKILKEKGIPPTQLGFWIRDLGVQD